MLLNFKNRFKRKFNNLRCSFAASKYILRPLDTNVGYLTILHDYEADYSHITTKDISLNGVIKMLDLEKEYNVKGTYNIVGKLMKDFPNIVQRIKREGHEIASHSFSHDIMTDMSKKQIHNDLKFTKELFKSMDIELLGFRSPQSKWNYKLLNALLAENFIWNAERDDAPYPYIIKKRKSHQLIRMPISTSDWHYKSHNINPENFFVILTKIIERIENEKIFGSICFHPWVQGEDNKRIDVFQRFLKYIKSIKGIKIVTFKEMYNLCTNKPMTSK